MFEIFADPVKMAQQMEVIVNAFLGHCASAEDHIHLLYLISNGVSNVLVCEKRNHFLLLYIQETHQQLFSPNH